MVFRNPTGYWEYEGSYSVLLADDAETDLLPHGATLHGHVVHVRNGCIKQTIGGIQFYAEGKPFCWSYKRIKEIRDSNDKLLWQNRDCRKD